VRIRDADQTWRALRSLRYDPPCYAGSGARRRVFGSALEQSEQLLRGSSNVGYESRPLLLFYGLSQAARAISAAAPVAGDKWQLQGHGIKCSNISEDTELAKLRVVDDGDGSFPRVAAILGSASLPQEVEVGRLWSMIPEAMDYPLPHTDDYPPTLGLFPKESAKPRDDFVLLLTPKVGGYLCGIPARYFGAPGEHEDLQTYLIEFYPSIAGFQILNPDGQSTQDPSWGHCVQLQWTLSEPLGSAAARGQHVMNMGARYPVTEDREVAWIVPRPAVGEDMHDLVMAWWAVLFVLSLLARYHPDRWLRLLHVDRSPASVAIERLLDLAPQKIPELVLQAIRDKCVMADSEIGAAGASGAGATKF
jgi:YaaC-like Protein